LESPSLLLLSLEKKTVQDKLIRVRERAPRGDKITQCAVTFIGGKSLFNGTIDTSFVAIIEKTIVLEDSLDEEKKLLVCILGMTDRVLEPIIGRLKWCVTIVEGSVEGILGDMEIPLHEGLEKPTHLFH
jgi:hypothetical protein